jgi:hypothetical protein
MQFYCVYFNTFYLKIELFEGNGEKTICTESLKNILDTSWFGMIRTKEIGERQIIR